MTAPLRARFGAVYRLDYYDQAIMEQIIRRAAAVLGLESDDEGIAEIARRGRGTPRVGLRLLRRVRDYAQVRGDGIVTGALAAEALALLDGDLLGLDDLDRRVLRSIIDKFNGGPVAGHDRGIDRGGRRSWTSSAVSASSVLDRTPRGRVATPARLRHLGLIRRPRSPVCCRLEHGRPESTSRSISDSRADQQGATSTVTKRTELD
jgi:Holliday junction DNA helicase RuvB